MKKELKSKLHTDHQEWIEELSYWNNELIYFNNVLMSLIEKTTDEKEVSEIELYKSKFDTLREKIQDTANKINAHEKAIDYEAETEGNTELNMVHEQIHWIMKDFYKEFRALKNDFYKFADQDCK